MEQMKSDIQQLKSGNVPSNAGFSGNISTTVIVLIIGIGVALFYYRKTYNNFNNKH